MVKTRKIQHLNNDPKNKIPTLKVEAGAQKGKLKKIKKNICQNYLDMALVHK